MPKGTALVLMGKLLAVSLTGANFAAEAMPTGTYPVNTSRHSLRLRYPAVPPAWGQLLPRRWRAL